MNFNLITFTILFHLTTLPFTHSLCRTTCGATAINYPFAIDNGCGSPSFKNLLNCSTDLFFQTTSGSYKVQSINYGQKTILLYDPSMSTCSILQPPRPFSLSATQSVLLPPSPDTVFALLNCSLDSPVLNRYSRLCFNFSGHSCSELYGGCNSFKMFNILTNSSPPCCFTSYNTLEFMEMNILDCSHYTAVINVDNLKSVEPVDWVYGIKLSFAVPDSGCERCAKSGGACGFDTETEAMICICSSSVNSSRECGAGTVINGGGGGCRPWMVVEAFLLLLLGAFVSAFR